MRAVYVQLVTQRQCVPGGDLGTWASWDSSQCVLWAKIPSQALPQKRLQALCGLEIDQGPNWLWLGKLRLGEGESDTFFGFLGRL